MSVIADERAQVFSPLAVLWMVLVAAFAFSAFLVLSAYAPDLRGGMDPGAHALSRSAVGYAGLAQLLRDQDQAVAISRRNAAGRDPALSLIVLTPPPEADKDELQQFMAAGPTLLVLPKWSVGPDPANPSWALTDGPTPIGVIDTLLASAKLNLKLTRGAGKGPVRLLPTDAAPGTPQGPAYITGPVDQMQTLTLGGGMVPLLTDDRGQVVLAGVIGRRVAVLSDPDLLDTQGIKDPRSALFATRLIRWVKAGQGPVAFDVSLDGLGSTPSLLKLAFSPPFLGVTLCLAAAAMLIGLQAAQRFGAPAQQARALAFGKRALADNSAALIRLARREPQMAARYLDLTRQATARALGVRRLSESELDDFLDRAGQAAGAKRRLGELAAEAASVKTRGELLSLAQALHQWRMEMVRERR